MTKIHPSVSSIFETPCIRGAGIKRKRISFLIEIQSYFHVANWFGAQSWLRCTIEPGSVPLRSKSPAFPASWIGNNARNEILQGRNFIVDLNIPVPLTNFLHLSPLPGIFDTKTVSTYFSIISSPAFPLLHFHSTPRNVRATEVSLCFNFI